MSIRNIQLSVSFYMNMASKFTNQRNKNFMDQE